MGENQALFIRNYRWSEIWGDCCGNLFLGIHSADLDNFEYSQTASLVSHSKLSKNYESNTAITSIVTSLRSQIMRIVIC
ncbi:hypothetical protein ACWIUD_11525 [Helicobacter sp. 23-1044]